MDQLKVLTFNDVILNRRGYSITGTLLLSPYHLVFSFIPTGTSSSSQQQQPKEIWICYPIIERMSKARGSFWINNNNNNTTTTTTNDISSSTSTLTSPPRMANEHFDHYTASHIRIQCKDFTYYSFDFMNDTICIEAFSKLSSLITISKTENDIRALYAYEYRPNMLEQSLETKGWDLYDPIDEYTRLELIEESNSTSSSYWRISTINDDYRFCPSYPKVFIVPNSISDNVLKHAGKFRSKNRIPVVVYKHRGNVNGNVIARCAQPLVGLNLQNRSIQDEKLIGEIMQCQDLERQERISEDNAWQDQPQRNLLIDLRPIANALGQHALGAGTENIDNYRGKQTSSNNNNKESSPSPTKPDSGKNIRHVEKIFCNIDNIHVIRDSLNKLSTILNDLDKYPANNTNNTNTTTGAALQQALTKTQWLHRLSIILQSVDRITKSIHLNNTNVIIHCSDGWDRTSQVSALAQLCLDPFYRTIRGFMILIEKEWRAFGFKFATRADHGGCIGAIMKQNEPSQQQKATTTPQVKVTPAPNGDAISETSVESAVSDAPSTTTTDLKTAAAAAGASVTSFLQRAARAARDIKNTAQSGLSSPSPEDAIENGRLLTNTSIYGGSSERSPVFHQFLDCVYQIYRQHPTKFEFNSRFLKRLFYHYYSCQYGSFLCDSEYELYEVSKVHESTVCVWDYFNSRPTEFINRTYKTEEDVVDNGVIFFNFADVKWWFELYGRSDEEMNGLSNSLDRKFAQMNLNGKEKSGTPS